MKKFSFIALCVLLIAGMTTDCYAAKKRAGSKAKSNASASKVTVGETETYSNGLTFREYSIKKGESKISIEYPIAGNPDLVNAIRRWIVTSVDSEKASIPDSPEALLQKVIKRYASKGALGMNGETMVQEIEVEYCNDNIITLTDEFESYMGGAHGMYGEDGATFLMSDGTRLTKSMLPGMSSLRNLIIPALEKDKGTPLSDWCDVRAEQLELPELEPFILSEGLVFQYAPYEISCFAAGMPKAVIPLSKMRGLVTGKAALFMK